MPYDVKRKQRFVLCCNETANRKFRVPRSKARPVVFLVLLPGRKVVRAR